MTSNAKSNSNKLPLNAPSPLDETSSSASTIEELIDWRVRDKTRTVAAGLILCLHLGVDPPDVWKPSPCAKWECWVDPTNGRLIQRIGISSNDLTNSDHLTLHLKSSVALQPTTEDSNPEKTRETIARNLQCQYEAWQPRVRYKSILDPTVEEVRKLCSSLRKSAKKERVLLHYNGHGVPKPTRNGELWVFNKQFTQYIPVNVADICTWIGFPAIWILDCPAAAFLSQALKKVNSSERPIMPDQSSRSVDSLQQEESSTACPPSNTTNGTTTTCPPLNLIVFSASDSQEALPLTPILPADILTSCLTTPLDMAIRWHCYIGGPLLPKSLSLPLALNIPGKLTDRRTPLGELNWIFTAITDTIAWLVLPRDLFRRLYRQDLLLASLSRNFLLAQRILKSLYCTATSFPSLPPTHQHSLWTLWDHALDTLLAQVMSVSTSASLSDSVSPTVTQAQTPVFNQSTFFLDQLDAFTLWLHHHRHLPPEKITGPPDQLPSALQILLSQNLRPRALRLFAEFCDFGPWACLECLHVGIHPYILKLLQQHQQIQQQPDQSHSNSVTKSLLHIWTRLISVDPSCKNDLIKDSAFLFLINSFHYNEPLTSFTTISSIAAILAFSSENPAGCEALLKHQSARDLLQRNAIEVENTKSFDSSELLWRLLLLAQFPQEAKVDFIHLYSSSKIPEIRAAVLIAQCNEEEEDTLFKQALIDPSPLVRLELLNKILLLQQQHQQGHPAPKHPNILKSLQTDPFEAIRLRAGESVNGSIKSNFVAHCLAHLLPSVGEDDSPQKLSTPMSSREIKKHQALNSAEIDLWLERPFSFRKFDHQVALLETGLAVTKIVFHPYKPHIFFMDSANVLRFWDWERDPVVELDSLPTLKLTESAGISEVVTSILPFSSPGCEGIDLIVSCTNQGRVRIDHSSLQSAASDFPPSAAFSCHDRNVLMVCGSLKSNELFLLGDAFVSRYNILHQTLESCHRKTSDNDRLPTSPSTAIILDSRFLVCGTLSGGIEIYRVETGIEVAAAVEADIPNVSISHLWAHTTESFFSSSSDGSIRLHRLRDEGGVFKCESSPIWNTFHANPSILPTTSIITTTTTTITTFTSHSRLPNLIVFGSSEHCIKLCEMPENTSNPLTALQTIKYHDGFLGHRLGSINRVALHPSRMVLAAVSGDSCLSIFGLKTEKGGVGVIGGGSGSLL